MNTASPSGMSIYPFNTIANNENSSNGTVFRLEVMSGEYNLDADTKLAFIGDLIDGGNSGTIAEYEVFKNGSHHHITDDSFSGTISDINRNGLHGSYKVNFTAVLPDGRPISIKDGLVSW